MVNFNQLSQLCSVFSLQKNIITIIFSKIIKRANNQQLKIPMGRGSNLRSLTFFNNIKS